MTALLKESPNFALLTGAIKPSDLGDVVVDSTVQPKNVARPMDARLLHKARESPVKKAGAAGIQPRQSYAFAGTGAFQCRIGFNKRESAGKELVPLRAQPGGVVRDMGRKIDGNPVLMETFKLPLRIAERVRTRRPGDGVSEHGYAVHAPTVGCIDKGTRHCPWGLGYDPAREDQGHAVDPTRQGPVRQALQRAHAGDYSSGH